MADNDKKKAQEYAKAGEAKYQNGDFQAALEDFDKAINLDPERADSYSGRGGARSELGNHEAALEDFDKAISLDPDDADFYFNRGNCKSRLGDHNAALEDYDKAISLDSERAGFYSNRGNCKSELGDHEAALEDYDKAISLDPENEDLSSNIKRVKKVIRKQKQKQADRKNFKPRKMSSTSLIALVLSCIYVIFLIFIPASIILSCFGIHDCSLVLNNPEIIFKIPLHYLLFTYGILFLPILVLLLHTRHEYKIDERTHESNLSGYYLPSTIKTPPDEPLKELLLANPSAGFLSSLQHTMAQD